MLFSRKVIFVPDKKFLFHFKKNQKKTFLLGENENKSEHRLKFQMPNVPKDRVSVKMIEHVMERVQSLNHQFCRESQTEHHQSTNGPGRNEGFSLHSERFSEGGKKVLKTDENSI
jgi:hypothetical protein